MKFLFIRCCLGLGCLGLIQEFRYFIMSLIALKIVVLISKPALVMSVVVMMIWVISIEIMVIVSREPNAAFTSISWVGAIRFELIIEMVWIISTSTACTRSVTWNKWWSTIRTFVFFVGFAWSSIVLSCWFGAVVRLVWVIVWIVIFVSQIIGIWWLDKLFSCYLAYWPHLF